MRNQASASSRYELCRSKHACTVSNGLFDSGLLLHVSIPLSHPVFRMSLMFGKARTCNIVTVPEHEPSECNIVILGAMGSGKSGMTTMQCS